MQHLAEKRIPPPKPPLKREVARRSRDRGVSAAEQKCFSPQQLNNGGSIMDAEKIMESEVPV